MRNILKKLALLLVPVAAYFAVFIAFEPNNYFGLHKVTDSESSISRLKAFQREKGSRVIPAWPILTWTWPGRPAAKPGRAWPSAGPR